MTYYYDDHDSCNHNPYAQNDNATVSYNTPIVINVLANDSDPDCDPLKVCQVSDPAHGSVVINADGTITYTPDPDYYGSDTFSYQVSDGHGGYDWATVSVNVCEPELDGIVEGTASDDLIDTDYTGDPEGDMVDHQDAILAGEAPNDDIILAGDGNDTVYAGRGDDLVEGGEGNDLIYGEGGNDTLEGEAGNDTLYGDGNTSSGPVCDPVSETVDWSEFSEDCGNVTDQTVDLGDTKVHFDFQAQDYGATATLTTAPQYVAAGESFDDGSALMLYGKGGECDGVSPTSTTVLTFSSDNSDYTGEVQNLSFRINDEDIGNSSDYHEDIVTLSAVDAEGNPVEISFEAGGNQTITDNGDGTYTIKGGDSDTGSLGSDDQIGSVLVTIADPTAQLTISYSNGGPTDQAIYITDMTFDTVPVDDGTGEPGDDSLVGGLGDDDLYGQQGNDTLEGDEGRDSLDGGEGDDSLSGGADDDTIIGGDGSDYVDGGDGDDLIDTSGSDPQLDLGFGPIPPDPDPTNDLDTVMGGAGNDTITTGDDRDLIDGGTGNDVIDAGIDQDTVSGGEGDDLITAGEGSDSVHGDAGDDTIYGGLGPGYPDELNIIDAYDPEPNNGKDIIFGDDGNDVIFGEDDDDWISGGADNDYIDGGIDEDTIMGDAGNDTLIGGQGADSVSGGDDRDLFLVNTSGSGIGDTLDGGEGGDDYDTLDLQGAGPLRVHATVTDYDPVSGVSTYAGTVDFLDGDGNVAGTLEFSNMENIIPCFTPGTRIATPKGEVAAEDLREGDKVLTRDNGIQEIRWAGRADMTREQLIHAPHLKPIMIKAGALGNGLPERDMMVSPNHRMLVANDKTALYFEEHEVLVAAKHLVGNPGISTVETLGTSYLHFMFDHHEVVLGNGAWTESFQPGDQTLGGMGNAQRQEIFEIFPDLKTEEGRENYQAARKTLKKHEAVVLLRG